MTFQALVRKAAIKIIGFGQWRCFPLIPALGRQRQVDFWDWGQPCLQSEFQDNQGYTEKTCLKNKTKQEVIGSSDQGRNSVKKQFLKNLVALQRFPDSSDLAREKFWRTAISFCYLISCRPQPGFLFAYQFAYLFQVPFDYFINQHPLTPALWFLGDSKHTFFSKHCKRIQRSVCLC